MATIDKKYKQVKKPNYKEPKIPAGGAKYIIDALNTNAGGKKKPSGGKGKKKK